MKKGLQHLWTVLLLSCLAACSTLLPEPSLSPQKKQEVAELNAQLGSQYLLQGKLDLAEKKFLKALDYKPKLVPAHIGLALVYEQQGKVLLAGQNYQIALKLAPKDPDTLNNYGTFLCRNGKISEAEEYFLAAAKSAQNMQPERAYENAGICYLRVPDYAKSETYLRLALKESPELPQALFSMARVSLETENYIKAKGYLTQYHELNGQSAQSLQLAIEIEERFGVVDQANIYKTLLLQKFPDSEPARTLRAIQSVGG